MAEWLPSHAVAALYAWGLREIIHSLGSLNTAATSALDTAAEPADSASKDTDALTDTPTSAKADAADDRYLFLDNSFDRSPAARQKTKTDPVLVHSRGRDSKQIGVGGATTQGVVRGLGP